MTLLEFLRLAKSELTEFENHYRDEMAKAERDNFNQEQWPNELPSASDWREQLEMFRQ